jgi:hypothetical protein
MSFFRRTESSAPVRKPFGTCCSEMRDALTLDGNRLLRVEDNGVLYMAVGYVETSDGHGWFDHAVLFCPFCGNALQSRDQIRS